MKKIMFNDRYELTEAVLSGRKTQTRRSVPWNVCLNWGFGNNADVPYLEQLKSKALILARYNVGEVVAVAQSYKDAGIEFAPLKESVLKGKKSEARQWGYTKNMAGYHNKMFTVADLMPRHIRITNVRVERLQYISDEDCIKEGIYKGQCGSADTHFMDAYYYKGDKQPYCTPREAYAALIDRISGKGTWERNPYVFVYDFELVK